MPETSARTDRPVGSGLEPPIERCMWSATAGEPLTTAPLGEGARCDVLIVGGGFNGCSAALTLAKAGADVLLIEAWEIGSGASGRNAGMVNPGQFIGPEEIEATLGAENGQNFVREVGAAPQMVRALIDEYAIDCGVDDRAIIRAAHNERAATMLRDQAGDWAKRGVDVEIVEGEALKALSGSERWTVAMLDHRGFTIQPLAYVRGLARAAEGHGARLVQNARVDDLTPSANGWRATVGGVPVVARKVILSTNAYTAGLVPAVRDAIVPVGAFGIATGPLSDEVRERILPTGLSLYTTNLIPLFFRYDAEGRLMVGSLGFLPRSMAGARRWAERALEAIWPGLPKPAWEFEWSGTLGLTRTLLPHFVEPAPGLIATVGCNGRGIAPNTYLGAMLAKIALGEATVPILPRVASAPYPRRALMRQYYDAGMRLYRNTALLR